MDRYSWIGVSILVLLLLIPIVVGKVPSMPRKSDQGWTSAISMREEPKKFWHYEETGAVVALTIFALGAFARKNFGYHDRRIR